MRPLNPLATLAAHIFDIPVRENATMVMEKARYSLIDYGFCVGEL